MEGGMRDMRRLTWLFSLVAVLGLVVSLDLAVPVVTHAQATISTGSIQGEILDPKGATVSSARITVTSKDTGQKTTPQVTPAGEYNTGGLKPGSYSVRVEAPGFKTVELPVTVQVGQVANGNVTLELGSGSTVITVESSAVQLNTEQSTVQGVMTTQQIENIPINGRNFLDLAQLEPGVQIQDGANFDPTKNGFSSISFGGRFGRTARIEVDGVDISDETVGTTTQNVPASAIQEFQVGQSTLDLSTELTSSGSVNVVTHSGSNDLHGEGFFYGRDDGMAARIAQTGPSVFTRHQYGANLGGPIIKNRLFFFGDFERGMQNLSAPVTMPGSFAVLDGTFNSPFRELEFLGRLDWEISPNYRAFYRFTYEQNRSLKGYIPNTFNPFLNTDNTPSHVGGLDFTTGGFTHSIRAGYMKFRNGIGDSVLGSNIFNPGGAVAISIGADSLCLTAGVDPFCSGANFLAPQKTFQINKQIKYDGSKIVHSHILRYGMGLNRINGGGFAAFIASAPIIGSNGTLSNPNEVIGNLPGGASNPLNYKVDNLVLGNGQGFATEKPAFGFPAGGQQDTRFQWYIGDSWKLRANLTLTYGLRYVRDTGRADSDLAAIPTLDQFGAGLGNKVNQPNTNFGPQLGIAWSPGKSNKTVIRVGGGLYYENAVWNNVLFDRPVRLQKGLFLGLAFVCPGGLTLPDGTLVTQVNGHPISQDCSTFIGDPNVNVLADAAALQKQYQQATITAGAQTNGSYIGNTLADGQNSTGNILIAPTYRTPRSWQMNVGVQRELWKGTVLSVDYLRNIGLNFLLAYDTNHVGDARYLNTAAALAAISATNSAKGCGTGTDATAINCAITNGATISDYAGNGLDSGNSFAHGFPCKGGCAFGGKNQNLGQNQMLFPMGRSVYNGLDFKLTSNVDKPFAGIKHANYQVAYSLSKFVSSAQDQDFINYAIDFASVSKYSGPNGLDRRHQLSAGAWFDVPLATRISFTTHWYSALPRSLLLPGGSIFTADLTGDGTFTGNTTGSQGDLLPGTNIGSFGRDVEVSGMTSLINSYNSSIAGKTLTPAGQALVAANLFTQGQLIALGATPQPIQAPPPGQIGLDQFFTFDLGLGWVLRASKVIHAIPEGVTIQPQVTFFNVFNRQNFDSPSNPLSGVLTGNPGSLNGTTRFDQPGCPADTTKCTGRTNLTSLGSGVFALGAPRQIEWGIKVTF
jgi:carboxypeptidase family protein